MDLAPVLTPVQHLGDYIREQRTAAQISLRTLAAKAGVSNPYLSQVERGLRRPSAGVLAQIAQGLSISTETLLVKAGILTQSGAGPVVEAIRADAHLTDHHKSVLIEVYSAFRRESGDEVPADPNRPADVSGIGVDHGLLMVGPDETDPSDDSAKGAPPIDEGRLASPHGTQK
jgi:transcriptional regulator with XRE-family HTH domain